LDSPKTRSTYTVEDRELLLGVYKKLFWNRLVEVIPERIAPNSITIMGQFCAVTGVVSAGLATYGYPILYGLSAIAWLAYLTADNVDGPHARRTGQTSILGEFLDHGLDGFANGALLITTCFVLRIEGLWMALFLAIGAMGFIVTFWEQYRTGRLVLPELSSTEGVTVVMILEIIACFGNEPTWLHLDLTGLTFSVYLLSFVLFCYAIAIVQPVWRATKAGAKAFELLYAATVLAGLVLLVPFGSVALAPSIAMGFFGADVVCRLIRLRHEGLERCVVAPYHWLYILPAIVAGLLPDLWTVDGWALVAAGLTTVAYARTLFVSGSMLLRHEAEQAAGEATV
jgi:phosphatidylglycerophosphate synthase